MAAASDLSDRLGKVMGQDVDVKPKGDGFAVEIRLRDAGAARRLMDRLNA